MNRNTIFTIIILLSFFSCNQSQVKTVNSTTTKTVARSFAEEKLVNKDLSKCSQATFAAGCFWHEETLFESINGVKEVISGYAGGTTENPTYESIESTETGHAETVNVYYDSAMISYPQLLKVYFEGQQDPTQVNGQGPDRGTQYRSVIFYRNNQEKEMSNKYINQLNASKKYSDPIATQVEPYTVFWRAEDEHQDYIDNHIDNPYVSGVCIPEIVRFQEKFPEMIKKGHSFVGSK